MRSILRWCFTGLAAISLLLLAAAAAMWVRGYIVGDWFATQNPSTAYGLGLGKGVLLVERCVAEAPTSYPPESLFHATFAPDAQREWYKPQPGSRYIEAIGMRGYVTNKPGIEKRYGLLVPFWLLVLLWAAMPAWWMLLFRGRWRRQRRRAAGLCVNCGYDLRSSPDRCPECGSTREIQPKPGL